MKIDERFRENVPAEGSNGEPVMCHWSSGYTCHYFSKGSDWCNCGQIAREEFRAVRIVSGVFLEPSDDSSPERKSGSQTASIPRLTKRIPRMPAPSQKAREYAGRDFDDLLKTLDSFTLELREALAFCMKLLRDTGVLIEGPLAKKLEETFASYTPSPEEEKG